MKHMRTHTALDKGGRRIRTFRATMVDAEPTSQERETAVSRVSQGSWFSLMYLITVPGRAQPQWSYPTANPQPHNGQDRGDPSQFRGAPPQPAQPLRGLPDPRAPRPGDEVAAQIHQGAPIFPRTATAPPRFAQPNFPADNQQPRSASTSQGPAQTAAIPIPGARTNDRVLRTFSLPQPGDSVLSSSPESVDLEPPQGPSKVNRTVSQNDSQRRQS
ncbi:hypothetical protein B0H10DRAFT_500296 [Mycena sp. CBHHK59/15]|nr:hypothetical protein B0H10DRAFT_500296 [Mycena sp. CBHHK59/15]